MVVGEKPLKRGDGPGWRFSGGILVFGGTHADGVSANSAVLLDNDYANKGELKARSNKNYNCDKVDIIYYKVLSFKNVLTWD